MRARAPRDASEGPNDEREERIQRAAHVTLHERVVWVGASISCPSCPWPPGRREPPRWPSARGWNGEWINRGDRGRVSGDALRGGARVRADRFWNTRGLGCVASAVDVERRDGARTVRETGRLAGTGGDDGLDCDTHLLATLGHELAVRGLGARRGRGHGHATDESRGGDPEHGVESAETHGCSVDGGRAVRRTCEALQPQAGK